MCAELREAAKNQSSKKTNNVRDPNLSTKMSDFHISVNNSQIRMIFLMTVVLKLLFIYLWSVAIMLCAISSKKIGQMSINVSDFLFQPKMSGFLQNNVRDPRSQDPNFLELCCILHLSHQLLTECLQGRERTKLRKISLL